MFLTDEEVYDLTHLKQRQRQAAWLAENGFHFRFRADGTILLLKDHVSQLLSPEIKEKRRKDKPLNFSFLND